MLCLFLASCSSTSSELHQQNQVQENLQSNESGHFSVQLLGINDFHGQVKQLDTHGGMYQLGRHLLHAISTSDENSFILHAGDQVGASPAESALLQDEPSIEFLNILNSYCQSLSQNPCSVIGVAGNHEFDEGSDEMLRLLEGGNHSKGPYLDQKWNGANYITLAANVLVKNNKQSILPPYVVHQVNEVPVGFIGITLDYTPKLVLPGVVDDLEFVEQAETVSKYVKELKTSGVKAIVVIVHDGSSDDYYSSKTKQSVGFDMNSHFGRFVQNLPDEVDVIISGHSHDFTNAYVSNKSGKQFLVTQAYSSGRAYSDITMTIDKASRDVVSSSAEVILTKANTSLELSSSVQAVLNDIVALKQASIDFAESLTQQIIGVYKPLEKENTLGQFIADSHRFALNSDLAVMNRGGVRATLTEGDVTWGDLFAIQPFNNALLVRQYSGTQLKKLIDQRQHFSSNVKFNPRGTVYIDGKSVVSDKLYTIGGNAYIMNSERFKHGSLVGVYGLDIDATVSYIEKLNHPFNLSSLPIKSKKQ